MSWHCSDVDILASLGYSLYNCYCLCEGAGNSCEHEDGPDSPNPERQCLWHDQVEAGDILRMRFLLTCQALTYA